MKASRRAVLTFAAAAAALPLLGWAAFRATRETAALEIDPDRTAYEYRDGWIVERRG